MLCRDTGIALLISIGHLPTLDFELFLGRILHSCSCRGCAFTSRHHLKSCVSTVDLKLGSFSRAVFGFVPKIFVSADVFRVPRNEDSRNSEDRRCAAKVTR